METGQYAIVGNFSHQKQCNKGFDVFRFNPATAEMTHVGTSLCEVNVGQQHFDADRSLLYFTDEFWSQRDEIGGGGYVGAASFDQKTGLLTRVSEQKSLGSNPSWLSLDHSRRFGVAVHHCTDSFVTKIVRLTDNTFDTETQFDDCAVVLFSINKDGSIGEVCDVSQHRYQRRGSVLSFPHMHTAVPDANGERFIITDTGLDKLYTYAIDYKTRCLRMLFEIDVQPGTHPRYGVFHPTLPIFYHNSENSPEVYSYTYNPQTGALSPLAVAPLFDDAECSLWNAAMPGDIIMDSGGRTLYISVRKLDRIAVLSLHENGDMTLRQSISCGGHNPRGLCLSPDGQHLLVANQSDGEIAGFSVQKDGTLFAIGRLAATNCPANISIFGTA